MALYSLTGTNGQLYVYEDHIELTRDGFLAKMTHWSKEKRFTSIHYSEIAEIKFRTGFLAVSGYFYFRRTDVMEDCNLVEAARDEDCIVFRSYENEKAKEIKRYLTSRI